MKSLKNFASAALELVGTLLCAILRVIIKGELHFERYVLKAYLNVEGPLYKIWWRNHAIAMQRKLDNEHSKYKTFVIPADNFRH